jgi:hypothetical protein
MKIHLFDERAHQLVEDICEAHEARLVRSAECAPEYATDRLTLEYIDTLRGLLDHSGVYLPNEERLGADLFLYKISRGNHRTRILRNAHRYATHLRDNALMHFPNYYHLLKIRLLQELEQRNTADEITRSGVVLLAAATIPNARSSIRRRLRRMGLGNERLLVADSDLDSRIANFSRQKMYFEGAMIDQHPT